MMQAIAAVGKGAGVFIITLLKSKWFWIALGILIAVIIVINQWKSIRRWLKEQIQPVDIDLTAEEKERLSQGKEPLTDEREGELKDLAELLYSDIYDTPVFGHNSDLYEESLLLSDTELEFMSNYYRKNISGGVHLFTDIDNELFSPFTNIDSRLMAKLSKVGERGF